jgi:hypothetical protein
LFFRLVKPLIDGGEVFYDRLQLEFLPVNLVVAVEAVPFNCIELTSLPFWFDNQTNRPFLRALGRVSDMRWQKENLALADGKVVEFLAIIQFEKHVTFKLVKELFHRVVVIICPFVGSAHNGDHQIRVFENHFVAHRGLQKVTVFVDPGFEIKGSKLSHVHLLWRRISRYNP